MQAELCMYFCNKNYIDIQCEDLSTEKMPLNPDSLCYRRSKPVVLELFLFLFGLWFYYGVIMEFFVLVFFQSCFALLSQHLGKRELVYVLLVKSILFILHALISVLFLFLLMPGVSCGL